MYLIIRSLSLGILLILLQSCETKKQEIVEVTSNPNIILMIGDGMGLSQLSSAYYYGKGKSNFSRFKEIGLINTSSSSHKITDSGAGATAFACGKKSYNGSIGVNSDSLSIPNIVELLSFKMYNTAVIASSSVTHATPASFFSHVKSRSMQYDIAHQLVDSDIDFFAGGGMKYFNKRPDSVDLLPNLKENGFIINTNDSILYPDNKYGFILADNGMLSMLDGRGDFLPDYTSMAINYLHDKNENFFIMIEASQIDWGGHAMNSDYLIGELLDFDKTIGLVMDYAEDHPNTLVIVLADHETGGFSLSPDDGDYGKIKPAFSNSGHSTTLIPVLTYGKGSENFKGIYQNNEIFHKMLELTDN